MSDVSPSKVNIDELLKDKPRIRKYLTIVQMEEICDVFMIPFNGIDTVISDYNEWNRMLSMQFLENVTIYDGMFDEYKEHLSNKFRTSLMEAETPIGANASDAIGQQATQALLNTFHSVGTIKSGGPDGINENISISANRQILYSVIHLINGKMTYKEVMDIKKDFIGLSIKGLLLEEPEPHIVDIGKEYENNPFDQNKSLSERKKIFLSKNNWWYNMVRFDGVYDRVQSKGVKRTCVRLKFDIQKVFEFKFLLSEIAAFISKWKFEIKIPKRSSENKKKHDEKLVEVFAVASPTNIGIIDVFLKSYDEQTDHLLISLIHSDEFNELMISGIENIKNFYAVSSPVVRLIRDISETSRFDEEKGIKGTWIYLKDNRFDGIPYFRLIELLEASGLKVEIPYFNVPNSYRENFTTLPLEYHSHKSCPDLTSRFKLRGFLPRGTLEHQHPSTFVRYQSNVPGTFNYNKINTPIKHYKFEKIGSGFDVCLYQFGESNELANSNSLCTIKFKSKAHLTRFINENDNRLKLSVYRKNFNNKEEHMTSFFKESSSDFKTLAFEIASNPTGNKYVVFYLFQLNYIDYQIDVNLDYVNSRFVTMSLDSVLMKHFGIPFDINNNFSDTFRVPKKYDVERIEPVEKRILVKGKMFFTDKYDYLGDPKRKELLADKTKKIDPIKRLLSYITSRTTNEQQTYVSAEASGSNLSALLKNDKVFGSKSFCNHFHQTWHALGHECLRNLLCYDMISMINNQGYISVNYINFTSDVITHNGINPMTSEGISCQGRDFLSMITFDNASKYIMNAALIGKSKSVNSTSSSIFLGKRFKLGTGAVDIGIDRTKININSRREGISEGFLRLTGLDMPTSELFLPDGSDEVIVIPKLIVGRMKPVKWIIDKFVEKDILYYIQRGIDNYKRITYMAFTKFPPNLDDSDSDDVVFKTVRQNKHSRM